MDDKDMVSQIVETVQIMLDNQTREMKAWIENDIGRRIDAVAEGHAIIRAEQQNHDARITALEDKTRLIRVK